MEESEPWQHVLATNGRDIVINGMPAGSEELRTLALTKFALTR